MAEAKERIDLDEIARELIDAAGENTDEDGVFYDDGKVAMDAVKAILSKRFAVPPSLGNGRMPCEVHWRVVDAEGGEVRGGGCESAIEAMEVAAEWNERAAKRAASAWLLAGPFRVQQREVYETEWVDAPADDAGGQTRG